MTRPADCANSPQSRTGADADAFPCQVDCIIVGQGIAGVTLAWMLRKRGLTFYTVDSARPHAASRVAAGLITPVTGPRLALAPNWNEFWNSAVSFYREIERETQTSFFEERTAVRLLRSPREQDALRQRQADPEFQRVIRDSEPALDVRSFQNPHGGFEMMAGRLHVGAYLDASLRTWVRQGIFLGDDLDLSQGVQINNSGVRLPRFGVSARSLIFCQGAEAMANPWFSSIRWTPAKGELLTLDVPGLEEQRAVHRGVWLAPAGANTYQTGATYEWNDLTPCPTSSGRTSLLNQLNEFLKLPYKVQDHQAGIRPVLQDQRPVIGMSPDKPNVGIFNGLGSRGCLIAPRLAELFAEHLVTGSPIPSEWNVRRWFR